MNDNKIKQISLELSEPIKAHIEFIEFTQKILYESVFKKMMIPQSYFGKGLVQTTKIIKK